METLPHAGRPSRVTRGVATRVPGVASLEDDAAGLAGVETVAGSAVMGVETPVELQATTERAATARRGRV